MADKSSSDQPVFDEWGFLEDPDLWNRDLALGIAAELDLPELTEDHWRIIDGLRDHYLTTGNLPAQQILCHELDLIPTCVTDLFGGPIEAWKVAGLPDPGEEARTYMANMEKDIVPLADDDSDGDE
ncbi:dissimilatory sulfite reductase (desulfoviridin), gamma subunit [Thioflavicoccus mobilis 8321]|uniref:Dissimilatory sulfite reductase (Desulfoviridin), gamma subunit n=1 Tax=Thioflavicoccus mobilis 8321 TaxID=765912 RepID=L0GWX9_9GAMM|nr:TusE/DsrC/DsvC family sulfur relay protein [Thioflavicoccus mobilis]AGA90337.1 dissimilatory sulfite reductase (desulfoviridin), gamma subunit [Thioflavicoccus mobilis 8321]